MTSAIEPIGAIGGLTGAAPIAPIDTTLDIGATTGVEGAGKADFASTLASSLQQVQDMQHKTSDLSVQAATGTLSDVHDYMIASAESGIATQLTSAVRNKAVEAFQEIMRMQA
ncbi:flagellar hook-basal body complex protein FliE [Pilimelia terevasa]|uniref:Flagellar hook-basal body complex protein FliE n=1 Tax=Pilimelia terevasa TaxID=53372 RepID=A0A8J3BLR2_9ACTN|nr:flagellar hook-basal body complex protein FliE [Pilimelia terevasa]GGK18228.1 flagellar hook-basal body complex protein FliE [Pilimelia terevasa]